MVPFLATGNDNVIPIDKFPVRLLHTVLRALHRVIVDAMMTQCNVARKFQMVRISWMPPTWQITSDEWCVAARDFSDAIVVLIFSHVVVVRDGVCYFSTCLK